MYTVHLYTPLSRDIDAVLIKMVTRCHSDVQLHFELLCAREAVLCMEDTNTVRGLRPPAPTHSYPFPSQVVLHTWPTSEPTS
jgi:hypothetical protein